jgi:hypothetical protein
MARPRANNAAAVSRKSVVGSLRERQLLKKETKVKKGASHKAIGGLVHLTGFKRLPFIKLARAS